MEYGLLVVAIAAVIAFVVFAMGGLVVSMFASTCTGIHDQMTVTSSC